MANEIQESPSDVSSQKSVTDWLMHVISGKKPEDLLGEQARAEAVAAPTNGHHAAEATALRPEALVEMNAPPAAAPYAAVATALRPEALAEINAFPAAAPYALAEVAFSPSAPVSIPAPAVAVDVFGLPLTSNGNGHVEAVVEAAREISADDLCGPPAFGPVPKVAPKEEITADDLCFVPKPPKAQSNGTATGVGASAAAFETSPPGWGFAEPEPRRYVISTADILRERAPSLASEWINGNGNGHAGSAREATPVAETLSVAWPERSVTAVPEMAVEPQVVSTVEAASAVVAEIPRQEAAVVVPESPERALVPEPLKSAEPAMSQGAAVVTQEPAQQVITPAALFERLATAKTADAPAVVPEPLQFAEPAAAAQEPEAKQVITPAALFESLATAKTADAPAVVLEPSKSAEPAMSQGAAALAQEPAQQVINPAALFGSLAAAKTADTPAVVPEPSKPAEPAMSQGAAAVAQEPAQQAISPAALFESLAAAKTADAPAVVASAAMWQQAAVAPVEQPQTAAAPVTVPEPHVQAVPEPVAAVENLQPQVTAAQSRPVHEPQTQPVPQPVAVVENPQRQATAAQSQPVQEPQVQLVPPAAPEVPQGAIAIVPEQQTQGAGSASRSRVTKRMAKARRERVVTVADICRDWVLEEMLDRAAESGEIPKEEELEEDQPASLIEGNAAEPAESVFAHEGIWGDAARPEDAYQEQGLMTAGDAGMEAAREEVRSSGVKSLLKLGSMLPWLARDVPAVGGKSPENTALAQEVRHEVAGMRVVQQEIRTTVHDHSLQLRRVEDQLGRVRESLVAEAAGSQDLVTSVKSTTRTVQVVGIAVCALLGFVLVMVMLLFLHSR